MLVAIITEETTAEYPDTMVIHWGSCPILRNLRDQKSILVADMITTTIILFNDNRNLTKFWSCILTVTPVAAIRYLLSQAIGFLFPGFVSFLLNLLQFFLGD